MIEEKQNKKMANVMFYFKGISLTVKFNIIIDQYYIVEILQRCKITSLVIKNYPLTKS